MTIHTRIRLGIALTGGGWHPAARPTTSSPEHAATSSADWWTARAQLAAQADIDFVTIEDPLGPFDSLPLEEDSPSPAPMTGGPRRQLDAVVAAAVMLLTSDIREVVLARNVTHSNPFHVASQLASLDAIAPGRVVWRPQVSADYRDAGVVGGNPTPRLATGHGYEPMRIASDLRVLFQDAEEYVRVVRRLWSGKPSGVVSAGTDLRFTAMGPLPVRVRSALPTAVLAHHALQPYQLAAAVADRVLVTPTERVALNEIITSFRGVQELTRGDEPSEIYVDVAVVLGDSPSHAAQRLSRLNERCGYEWTTDTGIVAGTATQLAEMIDSWASAGVSGVRLRPAVIGEDDVRICRDLRSALSG